MLLDDTIYSQEARIKCTYTGLRLKERLRMQNFQSSCMQGMCEPASSVKLASTVPKISWRDQIAVPRINNKAISRFAHPQTKQNLGGACVTTSKL